jgi:hypothetical protein
MVSTALSVDGPVNFPHRSASLPMIPFLAGVLLTKKRAFLNRSPQQLNLLSNTNHQIINSSKYYKKVRG